MVFAGLIVTGRRFLNWITEELKLLTFPDGWNDDANPKLSEQDAKLLVEKSIQNYTGADLEFKSLRSMIISTSSLANVKVTKGMHQEQGNQLLSEKHMTVEIPDYPYPKRFHFFYLLIGKTWLPTRISYEKAKNNFVEIAV